ncbi:uncharacterized protein LOC135707211 [Ochlerotatus camptorhynchus]|uniref:uncharacterized protein LOC135707211 n=1 Tax=Ochlerotatus camptorhynchus TaxID=644619 RepID=UPI0031DC2EBC
MQTHSIMATPSKKRPDVPAHLQSNSNVRYISELKTITPSTTAKDLTEEQKRAFMAMMRMVHDPKEISWTKRREKLDRQQAARIEAASKKRQEDQVSDQKMDQKAMRRESLKMKVKKMRAERRFPLPSNGPRGEQARRYGFIPYSQRKNNLEDYAKI